MDVLRSSVKCQLTLVYLDDIGIFSKTLKERMAYAKMVSTIVKEVFVKIDVKKRAFFTNLCDKLGNVIKLGRLEVDNHTSNAIRKLEVPITANELRLLLRVCKVFRPFVLNFA